MKIFKKILTNKYLLTITAFGIWMLFFDRNDIPLQISRAHNLYTLHKTEEAMTQKIADTREELHNLKNSSETIEKYAREKYRMKKPNEDLFIVETVK